LSDLVLGQPPPPRSHLGLRFAVFGLIVVLVVGGLTVRLLYLQVAQGGYYSGLTDGGTVVLQPIRATRGLIYDRAGRLVATNVASYLVTIRPADLPFSQRDQVVGRLSELLNLPVPAIIAALDRNAGRRFDPVTVADNVSLDAVRIISEEQSSLPGVEVQVDSRRDYVFGDLLSHVLGYTGRVTGDDLQKLAQQGYLNDDVIGRSGVEAYYERDLRGALGYEQVELSGSGAPVRTLQVVNSAQPGDSLELSLDVDIQQQARQAIDWAANVAGFQRGVVIVMNPQTGEVLAMVSRPSYDDNLFARGISSSDYKALIDDPNKPMLNSAVNEQFPPGSTWKLVTASAALSERVINDRTMLDTYPYLTIGPNRYYDWNRKGFGPLNIYGAFAVSSDTFFYQLAGMLGIDKLADYAGRFGFGERTGIDLPGEARGIVPSNAWKQDVFNQPIFPGEVYHAAIGQGYDAVTPLQLLNAYCALANGGTLFQPQVVRRVLAPDGSVVRAFEPQVRAQVDIDPAVLRTIRIAAHDVVTSHPNYMLDQLPFVVGGKTGTAQFGARDKNGRIPYDSWFVAFVPKFSAGQPGDISKTDSELAVLALAYDNPSKWNAALETVKYFLQLHYDVGADLRLPDKLRVRDVPGDN
jgi:penicillin-binding protein 2